MQKTLIFSAVAIATAGMVQAAPLNVAADAYVEFSSGTSPDDTTVAGTLRVVSGAVFSPPVLDLVGNGTANPDAPPPGALNGDVYLDAGSIDIGAISVSSGSRLFVNTTSTTSSVSASGQVLVNANFFVTGTPATYASSGQTIVAAGATLDAGTFTFSDPLSRLDGEGTVDAGTFDFAGQGQISPGMDDFDTGTLTLTSNSVDLTSATLTLDFAPGGSDVLAINGDATDSAFVLPLGFDQFTPAELASHGPFVFLTADSMTADFSELDPSFTEIYDGPTLVGHMVLGTTGTSAYFQYQPVPEPTALGLVSLGLLVMRRRRSRG